ncbi:MAG: type I 3-dehydroquinate dehydratase [Candidatus Contendobacter sp.]|jgi:3-dehydroquinate dehydratase-1|nr:type I 3-dehydroquinate dehydratase [Candidatus Contendobacter sp.]
MSFSRPIVLKGKVLEAGKEPLVCTPLVGADEAAIDRELTAILPKKPDLIEWRVDFFAGIADTDRVVRQGRAIKAWAGAIPILFTRRSTREGGNPIPLDEDQVFDLYAAVCRAGCVDLFDYELSVEERYFHQAVVLAKETGAALIASFHDFHQTPSAEALVAKFVAMEKAGADIAKIAVMPRELRDVLTLLEATLTARHTISLPIISMSMGACGSLSRLFGWVFGSSVSFAVGQQSSAPGQVPIEPLNAVVEILQRALRGE